MEGIKYLTQRIQQLEVQSAGLIEQVVALTKRAQTAETKVAEFEAKAASRTKKK